MFKGANDLDVYIVKIFVSKRFSIYTGSKWPMLLLSSKINTELIAKTRGSKSQKMQLCVFKATIELIKNIKLDVLQFVQVGSLRHLLQQGLSKF